MRVSVYYNLHKKCLSVRSNQGDSYGKVIQHRYAVWLKDVKFIVNESGRKKVVQTKHKNVHAFVRGYLIDDIIGLGLNEVEVIYNPYKYDSFVEKQSLKPIKDAVYVKIIDKKIIAFI